MSESQAGHRDGDRRLVRCWTRLTGTPVTITAWQPQIYRRGTWWAR